MAEAVARWGEDPLGPNLTSPMAWDRKGLAGEATGAGEERHRRGSCPWATAKWWDREFVLFLL